ncbi:MAG: biotin carboxylase N-terminal domain-containing protein [Anaerolineae bacterium]
MFKKVLIANRGEIALRIIRTCRDMGITTIALYEESDRGSLHVRLADQCRQLTTPGGYIDGDAVLQIAREVGADAVHPGYGFLAERPEFIQACEAANIAFIGPSAKLVADLANKVDVMAKAEEAGFKTPPHSAASYGEGEMDAIRAEAERLGYPLIIKSCMGGRGRGAHLVRTKQHLEDAVRHSQTESYTVYGDKRVYLEHALLPAHQIGVQVIGDRQGNIIHLGEREGSIQVGNQKIVEEAPSPSLSKEQREKLREMGVQIAKLFHLENAGTVEFVVDDAGAFYFTEIKPRLQIEHPITEMISDVDLVEQQLRIAAGEPLGFEQSDIELRGWSILCRVSAEDPWNSFLPSPGRLTAYRLPAGPYVRVDTYAYRGCNIPVHYDPLLAMMVVWGANRDQAVRRAQRAMSEFSIAGVQTTVPLLQRILDDPDFVSGHYSTAFAHRELTGNLASDSDRRDIAIAAAIAYLVRTRAGQPVTPQRVRSGWHQDARRLPA